jgi:cell division topological specificity factor
MMGLFDRLFSKKRHTAAIAKERLKIVLAHERAGRNAPEFLPKLQKELIEVVGRYVPIRDDAIRVNLGKSGEVSLLEINIEIDPKKPTGATRSPERQVVPPRPPRPLVQPKQGERTASGT